MALRILIMLIFPIVRNLLMGTFFSLWEVPYLEDLASKSVLLNLLQKQSMLQLMKHVRKMYGFPD